MAKSVDTAAMDAALNNIANNANRLYLCSQAPVTFADVTTYSLGFVAITTGVGNGAYTLSAGAVSGRRLTLSTQTIPGTGVGIATHAVLVDTVNSVIKQMTTAPSYNMQVGVNQSVPTYDVWEIKAPV